MWKLFNAAQQAERSITGRSSPRVAVDKGIAQDALLSVSATDG